MDNYKVNIKFKDDGKSINELIAEVLKIEIQNKLNIFCINSKFDDLFDFNYFKIERCNNYADRQQF